LLLDLPTNFDLPAIFVSQQSEEFSLQARRQGNPAGRFHQKSKQDILRESHKEARSISTSTL